MTSSLRLLKLTTLALLLCGPGAALRAEEGPGDEAAEPDPQTQALMNQARALFGPLPESMPGAENDTPEETALGRRLYFEKRLSVNNSQSCNDCHRVDGGLAGVDNQKTSPGAKGLFGDRNANTTLNAGLQFRQFWDGRSADLVEQAKGPIHNPVEMGMGTEEELLEKLGNIPGYKEQFESVYDDGLTHHNIAEAIAAFERTLITEDRFDDFMEGDADALSDVEKKGLQTFVLAGCTACHNGPLLGGRMYQKMGLVHPYDTEDTGRFLETGNEADKFFFKVPTLRNIAATGPYFHDGKAEELHEAVHQMAYLQTGRELPEEDVESIVAFLGSLTGKSLKAAKED